VGGAHILALKTNGTLWSWGGGFYGETGDGLSPTLSRWFPRQIGTAIWSHVSAGNNVSFGIKPDGTLWAWGKNDVGQLGDGTTTNQPLPIQIGSDSDWARVMTDGYTTVVATKTDGSVWIWGRNDEGQYGNGTIGGEVYIPTQIPSICATLATPDFQATKEIQLYPNPASNQVTIAYWLDHPDATLELFDASGRRIKNKKINHLEKAMTLETSDLVKGVYFLRIKENKKTIWQEKLIVQ
jgi:hypothetical protein